MKYIKIREYKYFVLYQNPKTGVKEAFLYTDLRNKRPKKIETKGGDTNRNRSMLKISSLPKGFEEIFGGGLGR